MVVGAVVADHVVRRDCGGVGEHAGCGVVPSEGRRQTANRSVGEHLRNAGRIGMFEMAAAELDDYWVLSGTCLCHPIVVALAWMLVVEGQSACAVARVHEKGDLREGHDGLLPL